MTVPWTPEQIKKARRVGEIYSSAPPGKYPPEIQDEVDSLEAELGAVLGTESHKRLVDYVSLPDAIAEFFQGFEYSARGRQKFIDEREESVCEGAVEPMPLEWINEALDRHGRDMQLKRSLGAEVFAFYKWLLDNGDASLGRMCSSSPVKAQSTVYKYLDMLQDRGLIEEIPPVQRQWRALEYGGD